MGSDTVQGVLSILDIPPNICKSITIEGKRLLEGIGAMTNETSFHLRKLDYE